MGGIPPVPIGVNRIICGDCIEEMRKFPADFFDSIITDPPYGLGFMGKEWDTFDQRYIATGWRPEGIKTGTSKLVSKSPSKIAGTYDHSRNVEFQQWFTEWAKECLRVAKPGAIMLVFGGTRTFHRLTCAIEDAGWQIRDCMMWLYGSGFPKSHDVSKATDKMMEHYLDPNNKDVCVCGKPHKFPFTEEAKFWGGYGTALKPAWEPIIVAMKPLDGTFAQNAEKYGVAGLNINGGRIPTNEKIEFKRPDEVPKGMEEFMGSAQWTPYQQHSQGRWPANLILDEEAARMLDKQSGMSKPKPARKGKRGGKGFGFFDDEKSKNKEGVWPEDIGGGASRFFYVAKTSKKERNAGLENLPEKPRGPVGDGMDNTLKGPTNALRKDKPTLSQNNHPTVKPLALMEYLCKLTKTPDGGIVLDPFGGSGTTALACIKTNRKYVLIEKEMEYCEIARQRIIWCKEQQSEQQ